jgi:hypothetical protein
MSRRQDSSGLENRANDGDKEADRVPVRSGRSRIVQRPLVVVCRDGGRKTPALPDLPVWGGGNRETGQDTGAAAAGAVVAAVVGIACWRLEGWGWTRLDYYLTSYRLAAEADGVRCGLSWQVSGTPALGTSYCGYWHKDFGLMQLNGCCMQ